MPKYRVPEGRIVRGWVVTLDPTPEQEAQLWRDCGARRFAYNWAVNEIKTSFDHGKATGEWDVTVWDARALRGRWNRVKPDVAPWWSECSSHVTSEGIADATTALANWKASKHGTRMGPKARFPKFKKKGKDQARCRYSSQVYLKDARTIVLPKVGHVHSAEHLRPLWRHIRRGTGRVMSATAKEKGGRWTVSLKLEIVAKRQPFPRDDVVGVDVGIGDNLLIVMRPDGTVVKKVPNPKALRSSLAELRRASREFSRKQPGSSRRRKAQRKLARVHGRATSIRRDTLHKATTDLTKTHGAIVIEDLAVRQLVRGLRSHRKAWTDVAAGEFRWELTYKAEWYGCDLWVADRWYPSSRTCSACSHINRDLTLSDRRWACPACGVQHDRDENAATNLARLPAGWAEAQSDCKTAPVRHVVMKRVNLPGREAAA